MPLESSRFDKSEPVPYIITRVLGGIASAGVLYLIAGGAPGFEVSDGMASNGYSLVAGLVTGVG